MLGIYVTGHLKLLFTNHPGIPVVARPKSWVCGRSPAEVLGSNPVGGIDIYLLPLFRVVRQSSLRRTDHSSRGIQPSVVCLSAILKPLLDEDALTQ